MQKMSDAHLHPIRVYYEDTDAAGIVYYANYLRFAERARTEMLRQMGHPHQALIEGEGLAFAVRRCAADYRRPAKLDDLLDVETRLIEIGRASLDLEQDVRRGDDLLVAMEVKLACIDSRLKPARIPDGLRQALLTFKRGS
jgi:acyl-CoA thioester hydrolase